MTRGTVQATDPPEHSKLKRKVSRGLTIRRIAEMEPFIRTTIGGILDRIEPGTEIDFVHDVADYVPASILGHLCGIPEKDHKPIIGLVDQTVMKMATTGELMMEAIVELRGYLSQFVEERMVTPGDDLISRICAPDEDGERLDAEATMKFLVTLVAAGSETTRGLLSRGLHDLTRFPEQQELLRCQPSLMDRAIEEMIRYGNPAGQLARRTTAPTVVRGVEIPAKKQVILLLASANFDEDAFGPDADQFRIDRQPPSSHLGFGNGPHFCLGAGLARMETKVFFEELLARFSGWELTREPTPFPAFEFYRSFEKMPIIFTARRD
jgi:cytochrome P450